MLDLAGAVAFLIPKYDGFVFDFTLVEIYGGSHLTLAGSNVTVRSIKIIGDDTGHFHVGPYHTLELVEVGGDKFRDLMTKRDIRRLFELSEMIYQQLDPISCL